MSYTVFISHCMAEEDSPIVHAFIRRLKLRGMNPYLAEHDPQPGRPLSAKILERIRLSDLVIVFWTRAGSGSDWVNQEVGAARAADKTVVPLVEKGVRVRGLLEGVERVEFDRNNPDASLGSAEAYLARKREAKEAKEQRERDDEFWTNVGIAFAVAGAVAAFIGVIIIASRK